MLCFLCVRMQSSQEEQLKQKLLEEQFALLQGTITEAESIIQDAVEKLDDPLHIRCTSSPGPTLCPVIAQHTVYKQVNNRNENIVRIKQVKTSCLSCLIIYSITLCSGDFFLSILCLSTEHRLSHQSGRSHTGLHRQSENGPRRLPE